jgi:fatty-acyl-CoA synthase
MADVEALERIPLADRDLPCSTYEALQRGASIRPDKIALQFFLRGEAYNDAFFYTSTDLIELVTQTANMFHGLGIRQGDVVSMILPNVPQAFFTIWGAETAGIVNPINPMLEPQVMADIMNAAGTKVLVTMGPFPGADVWPKVSSIVDQVQTLETILQVDLINYLPRLYKLGAKVLRLRGDRGQPVHAKVLDFVQTVRRYPIDRLSSEREIQPDDIASYFHTGGTTGTPKLAKHTHRNEIYDAWAAAQMIALTADKVLFCGLPLFHVNGVIVTGLAPLMLGASVVLGTPQGYRGEVIPNFWAIVNYFKINYFSGVPTVYSALLNYPLGETDISSLEYAVCGAAPMPPEVFRQFEQQTGVRIIEGYGLTEAACVSAVNPPAGERRIGSVGFRLPYQEMQVVTLGTDGRYERDCATDEIGIIVVRGPNVFPGYTEEAHNHSIWVDTGDGRGPWLNTGDLGRQDAEGYFWLTGREKELIIRSGHNIDPQLIERPLVEHPDVALAAAVGRPDAYAGELPVAYVELQPGAAVSEEALLAYARERIGEKAAVPKAVHIIDELPQTAVGKIFKPALIQREVADAYRMAVSSLDGVSRVSVTAVPDTLHGLLAHVQVEAAAGADKSAVEQDIRQTLGQFSVHYELQFT